MIARWSPLTGSRGTCSGRGWPDRAARSHLERRSLHHRPAYHPEYRLNRGRHRRHPSRLLLLRGRVDGPTRREQDHATAVARGLVQGPTRARMEQNPLKTRTRHVVEVVALLAIGWSIAGAVYLFASPYAPNEDIETMRESKKYAREIERIGGKAAALTSDLNEWLGSLLQGERLSWMIGGFTAVTALVYAAASRVLRIDRKG